MECFKYSIMSGRINLENRNNNKNKIAAVLHPASMCILVCTIVFLFISTICWHISCLTVCTPNFWCVCLLVTWISDHVFIGGINGGGACV